MCPGKRRSSPSLSPLASLFLSAHPERYQAGRGRSARGRGQLGTHGCGVGWERVWVGAGWGGRPKPRGWVRGSGKEGGGGTVSALWACRGEAGRRTFRLHPNPVATRPSCARPGRVGAAKAGGPAAHVVPEKNWGERTPGRPPPHFLFRFRFGRGKRGGGAGRASWVTGCPDSQEVALHGGACRMGGHGGQGPQLRSGALTKMGRSKMGAPATGRARASRPFFCGRPPTGDGTHGPTVPGPRGRTWILVSLRLAAAHGLGGAGRGAGSGSGAARKQLSV